MEVPTIAVAILGGAFDSEELGDNDIEPVSGMLDKLQEQMVTGFNDVHIDLIDRSHFDRVTAERDALQLRLNAVEEENDRLRTCPPELEIAGYEGSSGLYYSRLAAVANGEQAVEPLYRVAK